MSASAFIVVPNSIVALSDGMQVDTETFEVTRTDTRKVYKVSEQVLITSAGKLLKEASGRKLPEIIQDLANEHGITSLKTVAQLMRLKMKEAPSEYNEHYASYHVFGYDEAGRPKRVHFNYNHREGIEHSLGVGNIGVMAHEADDEAREMFIKLVNEKYDNGRGLPVNKAAFEAWKETVRHFEKQGYLFGGELFMETVSPKQTGSPFMDKISSR